MNHCVSGCACLPVKYRRWIVLHTHLRVLLRPEAAAIRLVDPKNPVFKPLHQLLDHLYSNLHAQGIGATRRQSEIILRCDEDKL